MNRQMIKTAYIYKNVGETPLQALENFRLEKMKAESSEREAWEAAPMTYAGRLDPMAEGILLILIGDECKKKEKYLGLDKEYEIEVVLGINTDTYDALGLAEIHEKGGDNINIKDIDLTGIDLTKYRRRYIQKYPPYSSKNIHGKPLHSLARTGNLPDEMPQKEVEIYSIENIGTESISPVMLLERIKKMIGAVSGDFRQDEIKRKWSEVLSFSKTAPLFHLMKIKVTCSSGTYMRSLADQIGKDLGVGAFALSIKRTALY